MPQEIPSSEGKNDRKVLILAERNEMVRAAESMFLEHVGFQVQAVGCVANYLSEVQTGDVGADLIVMDYCMDCLRGPTACIAELRKKFSGASILLLCADTRVTADGDVAALVDAVLYKPASPRLLTEKIFELTGRVLEPPAATAPKAADSPA